MKKLFHLEATVVSCIRSGFLLRARTPQCIGRRRNTNLTCRSHDGDVNGLKDNLQHKTGNSSHGWQDLIETYLRETTVLRKRRVDVMNSEAPIAKEIGDMPISQEARAKLW